MIIAAGCRNIWGKIFLSVRFKGIIVNPVEGICLFAYLNEFVEAFGSSRKKAGVNVVRKKIKGTLLFDGITPATLHSEAAAAAEILRRGGLVAFPTETVYGLGGDALNAQAVAKIFRAKGRPQDNPLIVHIYEAEQMLEMAAEIQAADWLLAEHFWPGPLTLVLPKQPHVPPETTGGLDSVAIRLPAHPTALALLRAAALPVAGPSANTSGRPSPTTADHVLEDLAGRIEAVLDGGPCQVGVESTVLDLRGGIPRILRPGGITPEQISQVLQRECELAHWVQSSPAAPPSPGLKYTHYAPRAPLYLLRGEPERQLAKLQQLQQEWQQQGKRVGLLVSAESAAALQGTDIISLGSRRRPAEIAARLFAALREFDARQVDVILAEGYSTDGVGLALMTRLEKAAGHRVIEVG